MGMLQEVREHDGDLKVANMSVKIRNLFDMLGFSRLVRIYEDVDKAVEAFTVAPQTGEEAPEDSY
jgi:anti-anti-sigma regulatory factor